MDDILIQWWTGTWCGPCKAITPDVEALKAKGWNITKMDVDQNQELSRRMGIGAIPTFLILRNNVVIDRFSGAKPGKVMEQLFQAAANKP